MIFSYYDVLDVFIGKNNMTFKKEDNMISANSANARVGRNIFVKYIKNRINYLQYISYTVYCTLNDI